MSFLRRQEPRLSDPLMVSLSNHPHRPLLRHSRPLSVIPVKTGIQRARQGTRSVGVVKRFMLSEAQRSRSISQAAPSFLRRQEPRSPNEG